MVRSLFRVMPVVVLAFLAVACEGPTGPQGPTGADGDTGPQGPPGQDAMAACVVCHSSDATLVAIERQFRNSQHWTTTTFNRNAATCNYCHTHQGFMAVAVRGEPAPALVSNPAPINCRTCHNIHTNYDVDDYALTTVAPVDLIVGGQVDLGSGNLCANCHQSRSISPWPTIGGAAVNITNFRYGPHYGPQANIASATGFFNFPGRTIPDSPMSHGLAGCPACHMVPAFGAEAGGHVWTLRYGTANTALISACTGCHSQATSFDYLDVQRITTELMEELAALLTTAGILRADGYAVTGSFPAEVAAAFLNYRAVYYDGSKGVHHPEYVHALLQNTVVAMRARLGID